MVYVNVNNKVRFQSKRGNSTPKRILKHRAAPPNSHPNQAPSSHRQFYVNECECTCMLREVAVTVALQQQSKYNKVQEEQ